MMRHEFEQLTGIYVTSDLYKAIEAAYYDFNGNKQAFCMAYKKNQDGLASAIQRATDMESMKQKQVHDNGTKALQEEIEQLRKNLDAEQEWRPYANESGVSQREYEELKNGLEPMTDNAAKDWLYKEFGFAPSQVEIIREVDEYEINRHNQLRPAGHKIERNPYYNATDYYYIRFDCAGRSWEAWSGSLIAY